MPTPGTVYVLATGKPGVVKVGLTRRAVSERVRELSALPGYRGFAPLRILWTVRVDRPERVERNAKNMLRSRKLNLRAGCRELFRADARLAVRVVATAAAAEPPSAATGRPRSRRASPSAATGS